MSYINLEDMHTRRHQSLGQDHRIRFKALWAWDLLLRGSPCLNFLATRQAKHTADGRFGHAAWGSWQNYMRHRVKDFSGLLTDTP